MLNKNSGNQSDKPQVRISDPLLDQRDFLHKIEQSVQKIHKSFEYYNNVVVAVFLLGFVVVILTVAGILYQSWEFNLSFQNQMKQMEIQEKVIENTVKQQKAMIEQENTANEKLDEIKNLLNPQ